MSWIPSQQKQSMSPPQQHSNGGAGGGQTDATLLKLREVMSGGISTLQERLQSWERRFFSPKFVESHLYEEDNRIALKAMLEMKKSLAEFPLPATENYALQQRELSESELSEAAIRCLRDVDHTLWEVNTKLDSIKDFILSTPSLSKSMNVAKTIQKLNAILKKSDGELAMGASGGGSSSNGSSGAGGNGGGGSGGGGGMGVTSPRKHTRKKESLPNILVNMGRAAAKAGSPSAKKASNSASFQATQASGDPTARSARRYANAIIVKHQEDDIRRKINAGKRDNTTHSAGCNIWDEPAHNTMKEDGGQVVAATLNKLVDYLTSDKSSSDSKLVETTLLTYQSFTTPEIFFRKLLQRYNGPSHIDIGTKKTIQLRVCNVVRKWIDICFVDLTDDLINEIWEFIVIIRRDGNTPLADKIDNALTLKILGIKITSQRVFSDPPPLPKILDTKGITAENLINTVPEIEIARQMTLAQHRMYSSIRPRELLQLSWTKKNLHYQCPNLLSIIANANAISWWAAKSIVDEMNLRRRAAVMEQFVKLACHLRDLNNFTGLMALIGGINNACVLRLKFTKEEMSRKWLDKLDVLEKLMSTESSYHTYRDTLHHINPPCVPYLGVYMSDLTFIEEGNDDMVGNLINLNKHRLEASVILELQQFQQTPFNLKFIPELANIFEKFIEATPQSEEKYYQLSLTREPRGSKKSDLTL